MFLERVLSLSSVCSIRLNTCQCEECVLELRADRFGPFLCFCFKQNVWVSLVLVCTNFVLVSFAIGWLLWVAVKVDPWSRP